MAFKLNNKINRKAVNNPKVVGFEFYENQKKVLSRTQVRIKFIKILKFLSE